VSGEVYGTTRLGTCLHAPRVGAVGCDHMTISEFNVGHEAFVPFDKGALYESWPFQSRPKAPSVHNCQDRSFSDSTLTLQESRVPQICGVKGEAVALYREPLTTKEMWYPRFSHRVNSMAVFRCFQDFT